MTPAEKFRRVLALGDVARTFALARMRTAAPQDSDATLHRWLSIDLLPPELARIMRDRETR